MTGFPVVVRLRSSTSIVQRHSVGRKYTGLSTVQENAKLGRQTTHQSQNKNARTTFRTEQIVHLPPRRTRSGGRTVELKSTAGETASMPAAPEMLPTHAVHIQAENASSSPPPATESSAGNVAKAWVRDLPVVLAPDPSPAPSLREVRDKDSESLLQPTIR